MQDSEEEEELLDEDDVFADDEDFGSQPSATSSREDLSRDGGRRGSSGRRRRVASSPPPAAHPPPATGPAHYHPRPTPPQVAHHSLPGSHRDLSLNVCCVKAPTLTPEQLFLAMDPLNGNFIPPNGASKNGAQHQRNSIDKPPIVVFPSFSRYPVPHSSHSLRPIPGT